MAKNKMAQVWGGGGSGGNRLEAPWILVDADKQSVNLDSSSEDDSHWSGQQILHLLPKSKVHPVFEAANLHTAHIHFDKTFLQHQNTLILGK
jgi:hypothetical protein